MSTLPAFIDLSAALLAAAVGEPAPHPVSSPLVQWAVQLVLGTLCASVLLALLRLMRGPTTADRVVALDLTAVIIVGMTSVHAVGTGEATYISVAIVLALIAFLGTVAFAFYVQKGGRP